MKKDAPLAFRIPNELKRGLERIAVFEARSISQICEILLSLGIDAYQEEGPSYLHRYLSRRVPPVKSD